MKESETTHVAALLSSYHDWQAKAHKVLLGMINVGINGQSMGASLEREEFATIQKIVLRYCARNMIEIRKNLISFKIEFADGHLHEIALAEMLWENHGQVIADAVEAKKKGG